MGTSVDLAAGVAPGNCDLLPIWVFFGLKRPWPAG